MQFLYQPLTWGFLLVLAPLVIHLITRMRHQPIEWAAMEFLLASYRKHQRSVWLKQLLLLLTRMLLVALLVAMLAGLVTLRQWSRWFGGKTVHHFVVLDDSLSMSDRVGGTAVFDRARQAIIQIATQAAEEQGAAKLTVVRYSRAARTETRDAAAAATYADLNAELISAATPTQLEEQTAAFTATDLALSPKPALELVEQLIDQATDEQRVLHLLSDFRTQDWNRPTELREILSRLERKRTQLHLIRCAVDPRPNLAIVELTPNAGTQAAGVPLFVRVRVRNFSASAVEQVLIKVRSTFFPASLDGSESVPQAADLPDVLIERIAPGEATTRQLQVYFPTAGRHVVQATLPADAVIADNQRWCIVDLPLGEPVTIIDGDPEGRAAYYLESIFQPAANTKTGILPETQPISYLRDATPEELASRRAIYLLDVPQLESRAVENLQQYVRNGGGLAVFLGPNTNLRFLNNLYADGNGLFPIPLEAAADLPADLNETEPDLQFVDHPIFRVLAGQRNPFASSIRIQRYFTSPPLWKPPRDSTIEVLARLRNRQPLVVERSYGEGRVTAFLTTFTPTWNNWALEPSFIVATLQLHAHLANPQRPSLERTVGEPIRLQLDSTEYRPAVTFLVPTPDGDAPASIDRSAEEANDNAPVLIATLGRDPTSGIANGETDVSGVYEALLRTLEGTLRHRRYALNTNPIESDLSMPSATDLVDRLAPLPVQVVSAEDLLFATGASQGQSWSQILLLAALGLLLGEQLLAYSASYHPKAASRKGGTE